MAIRVWKQCSRARGLGKRYGNFRRTSSHAVSRPRHVPTVQVAKRRARNVRIVAQEEITPDAEKLQATRHDLKCNLGSERVSRACWRSSWIEMMAKAVAELPTATQIKVADML